jgi:hypothetical protein
VSPHRAWSLLSGLGLAGVTLVLFLIGRGPLGDLPWTQPVRLLVWWHAHGTLLLIFGLSRQALFWIGCYLVAIWALKLICGWRRTSPPLNSLPCAAGARSVRRARLPGIRLAGRATLGLAAAGSAWTAGAEAGFAVSAVGEPGPSSTNPTADQDAAPVLRYLGPNPSVSGDAAQAQASGDAPQAGSARSTGSRSPPTSGTGRNATSPTTPSRSSRPPLLAAPRAPASPPSAPSSPPGPAHPASPPFAAGAVSPFGAAVVPPLPGTAGETAPSRPPAPPLPASSPASPGPQPTLPARRPGRPTAPRPSPGGTQPRRMPRPAGTWIVRPGDNLWSIAEATLTEAWGHPPAQGDLGPYWWRVVQVNRPNLPDPDDPNLLLPGDRVSLPPFPPAPAQF